MRRSKCTVALRCARPKNFIHDTFHPSRRDSQTREASECLHQNSLRAKCAQVLAMHTGLVPLLLFPQHPANVMLFGTTLENLNTKHHNASDNEKQVNAIQSHDVRL